MNTALPVTLYAPDGTLLSQHPIDWLFRTDGGARPPTREEIGRASAHESFSSKLIIPDAAGDSQQNWAQVYLNSGFHNREQDGAGPCTDYNVATTMEWVRYRKTGIAVPLSGRFLHNSIHPQWETGSSSTAAATYAAQHGTCRMSMMGTDDLVGDLETLQPYMTAPPTAAQIADALNYKLLSWGYCPTDLNAILALVRDGMSALCIAAGAHTRGFFAGRDLGGGEGQLWGVDSHYQSEQQHDGYFGVLWSAFKQICFELVVIRDVAVVNGGGNTQMDKILKGRADWAAAIAGSISVAVRQTLIDDATALDVDAGAPGASATAVSASPNPATAGNTSTLTATVTGASPSGTVTFRESGVAAPLGPPVPLTGGVATLSVNLAQGSHLIVANYSGDAANEASVGTATLTVNAGSAQPVQTTTTLASSPNPSTVGAAVTFTATVNGASPSGTVNFSVDGKLIDSPAPLIGKVANLVLTNLAVGPHSIVATYVGDASNLTSSSTPLSQVIQAAGGGGPNAADWILTAPGQVQYDATGAKWELGAADRWGYRILRNGADTGAGAPVQQKASVVYTNADHWYKWKGTWLDSPAP